MKRLLVLICSVMLVTALFVPVYAYDVNQNYVVDKADLLSDAEEAELEAKLTEASNRLGCAIVVLTESGIDSDPQSYADDYFDYNGYGPDGVLLLVDMVGRDWHISTCGICVNGLMGNGLDYISENIVSDLQEEDYVTCFNTFADRCDEVISVIITGEEFKEPFGFFSSLLVCFAIGFVISLIITLIMKGKLKSVQAKAGASDYLKQGSLNITTSHDMFLYRQVRRTEKPQSTSSSGSHTSSSGRTHGGTGGKF